MNLVARFEQLVEEAVANSLSGWDFSFVEGRVEEAQPVWNYPAMAARRIACANSLLDMCTGGGELLAQLLDQPGNSPGTICATEGHAPNIQIATDRLAGRGVDVIAVESDERLPLADNRFDLILNRHGAYSPAEVARVGCATGAVFLTQQVGSSNSSGLNARLGSPVCAPDWDLAIASTQLREQGFVVREALEDYPRMAFRDIGAVVFYLQAIPWQIPDFELPRYRARLFDLHRYIEQHGEFAVRAHRFLIVAEWRGESDQVVSECAVGVPAR